MVKPGNTNHGSLSGATQTDSDGLGGQDFGLLAVLTDWLESEPSVHIFNSDRQIIQTSPSVNFLLISVV